MYIISQFSCLCCDVWGITGQESFQPSYITQHCGLTYIDKFEVLRMTSFQLIQTRSNNDIQVVSCFFFFYFKMEIRWLQHTQTWQECEKVQVQAVLCLPFVLFSPSSSNPSMAATAIRTPGTTTKATTLPAKVTQTDN